MSPHRLRSQLYYSAPKPASRPPPLWQAATALDRTPVLTVDEARKPLTSAVLAGWICVGVGLLTAWFFPLAHVFFSIAIILSVVAMATHQVRAGLLLLVGSLVSIGFCAVLFVLGVAALVAGAFHAAAKPLPERTPMVPPPTVTTRHGPVAQEGTVSGNATGYRNVQPLTMDEILTMLGNGKQDDQIIAAIIGRPLRGPLGPEEITSLRVYGAGEHLVNYLQARSASGSGQRTSAYVAPTAAKTFVAPPTAVPALPVTQLPAPVTPLPAPVDHAERDRQVQNLKSQIDALDEQVRRIRENPKDSRYWWHYSSPQYNGIDQARLDAYLKELDCQRNDLRRQKWALEGR